MKATVPCVNSTSDSPVGKLQGKDPDPCVNSSISLILLLQLRRKVGVHVSTRDEALLLCGDSKGTSRFMSALVRKPQDLALTPHEESGPATDWRGIPSGPSTRMEIVLS